MKRYFPYISLLLLLFNTACSTVIEGRTQRIAIDTFPVGANCVVKDNELILARVTTPATAEINKSKNDILVECSKEGYITNHKRNNADIAITSVGNMVLGQWSFIGNAVDSASGANHKYDSKVFVALSPLPPVALAQAVQPPPPAPMPAQSQEMVQAAPVSPVETQDIAEDEEVAPASPVDSLVASAIENKRYIVTNQPLDVVLRSLMTQTPVPAQNTQEVADLSLSIQHQSE